MVVFANKEGKVRLTQDEKKRLAEELNFLYSVGAKWLRISSLGEDKNVALVVKNNQGDIIAYLIGESATLLRYMYQGYSTRRISTIDVDILSVINEHLK